MWPDRLSYDAKKNAVCMSDAKLRIGKSSHNMEHVVLASV